MLYRYFVVVFFAMGVLIADLSLIQPVSAENLVSLNAETRLLVALRVAQPELQKLLPPSFQITPPPDGVLKEANFFIVFIDPYLTQDAQRKLLKGPMNKKVVFATPAKNMHTNEMVTVVLGGFETNKDNVPGPYKNYSQATIRKEQILKGEDAKPSIGEEFWEVRDDRRTLIDLRIQYSQGVFPLRMPLEQKVYSAVEPNFYRIYRQDIVMEVVKSNPAKIDRMKSYQFKVAVPQLSNLFNGTEQLVGIITYPLFLRQVFLP